MKGPIGFLVGTVGGWALIRAAMLWPDAAAEAEVAPRDIAWQAPLAIAATPSSAPPYAPLAAVRSARVAMTSVASPQPEPTPVMVPRPATEAGPPAPVATVSSPDAVAAIAGPLKGRSSTRFSLSTWTIVRDAAGGNGLAAAGQLAGSQAGLRARYDLGNGFAVAGRVAAPLRSRRGREVAVALDWQPARTLPVTFSVERRAGLDRGGRDAFVAGMFGGFDAVELPLRLRLDGYGQAGLVGLKRRDPYVDGAIRAERRLIARGDVSLAVGAGIWGGAQPGVSRLDVGPQLVARAPVGPGSIRIGAEWRQRAAGQARPGSGPVLSVGTSF